MRKDSKRAVVRSVVEMIDHLPEAEIRFALLAHYSYPPGELAKAKENPEEYINRKFTTEAEARDGLIEEVKKLPVSRVRILERQIQNTIISRL